MKDIDEARLESDVGYRFNYLSDFIGFDQADIDTIHAAAPLLAPLVPQLVDGVYSKLHSYTSTWRHFVPKQSGYDGEVPSDVKSLSVDHPQIQFRKQHLARYLQSLVTKPYDASLLKYLDMVGKIHTKKAGNAEIVVPLVQMNALMGFVADVFNSTILGADLPEKVKHASLRAFSKLLWLQNDFIVRHYAAEA